MLGVGQPPEEVQALRAAALPGVRRRLRCAGRGVGISRSVSFTVAVSLWPWSSHLLCLSPRSPGARWLLRYCLAHSGELRLCRRGGCIAAQIVMCIVLAFLRRIPLWPLSDPAVLGLRLVTYQPAWWLALRPVGLPGGFGFQRGPGNKPVAAIPLLTLIRCVPGCAQRGLHGCVSGSSILSVPDCRQPGSPASCHMTVRGVEYAPPLWLVSLLLWA